MIMMSRRNCGRDNGRTFRGSTGDVNANFKVSTHFLDELLLHLHGNFQFYYIYFDG